MKYLIIFVLALTLYFCDFKSAQDYFEETTQLEVQEKYSDAILLPDKVIEKKTKINTI